MQFLAHRIFLISYFCDCHSALKLICRQIRVLWLTCRREYCKCFSSIDSSEADRRKRENDSRYWEFWEIKLNKEDVCDATLSAISTLIEDAPEIILLVYISSSSSGIQPDLLGKV